MHVRAHALSATYPEGFCGSRQYGCFEMPNFNCNSACSSQLTSQLCIVISTNAISLDSQLRSRDLHNRLDYCNCSRPSTPRSGRPAGRRDDTVILRPLVLSGANLRQIMTDEPSKTTAHPRRSDCPYSHCNFEHLQHYYSLWVCPLVDFCWYFQLVHQLITDSCEPPLCTFVQIT